jgi:putative ABC transport system permease protein
LLPVQIDIYPKTFEKKDVVTEHLDDWNKDGDITVFKGTDHEKVLSPQDRAELSYTDTIKLIISVINTLITTITIALVAFTSLALVVSCFMIAVITYISVVERTKEIGIIRSVGGRKKDVSRLFIAETFMTGFFSGVFGLVMTYIFEIVFNAVMYARFGVFGIANLTVWTALIMLGISILLSVLSGLIPSMKASHQDPVIALRSGE